LAIPDARQQREYDKFVEVGTGTGLSVPTSATAIRSQLYGVTVGGTGLPMKVIDDGSGLGKVSVQTE